MEFLGEENLILLTYLKVTLKLNRERILEVLKGKEDYKVHDRIQTSEK